MRNGELDVGVTTILPVRCEDLIEENLYDEEFVVYASANHRLAKRKQVTLADIAQEQWATSASNDPPWQRLNEVFRNAGLSAPRIGVETTDLPFRHHTVAASDLLAFGSRDMVRYAATRFRIRQLHVKDLSYTRSVSIIYRKEAYLPPVGRRFIEILKATAKEIAAEKA